ncbi:MAG: M48 family metalloprotease [Rhodospirillales bacterium]|nr:M48 family metalloprotease [Rhodospirillales bacterium]MCW8861270.1 M48 family metalloprotease [Rhodospirillales bacterium]MCW8952826.1 M48 family metalloprotease [Rhodospirillales bacterium]MCW8970771.1 M48 family metalloprotease [Rhodospirillales bacterium]MCW9001112.1 M48 family metalloprotease [Rhodospirillales bacterium]
MEPSTVRIHLIKDRSLNAFVAGGLNLFIHTGLLIESESAGQVIGVIAHETGHIAGGHLARSGEAMENATAQTILSWILGGAMIIGGRPDVGSVVIQGGEHVGLRGLLAYTRTQETSADQAAVQLLDATGQSAKGLMEFMEKLEGQELLSARHQNPYARTHPLSSERIIFLRNHIGKSAYSGVQTPPEMVEMHHRMQAKLFAFIEPTSRVLRHFKESDNSIEARYARAIAYHRKSEFKTAIDILDGLIAERPNDPYFHELKGQVLFESGNALDALPPYQKAAALLPDSALIRLDLGRVQIATEDPGLLPGAIENLRTAVRIEPQSPFAWRQLGIAYGLSGQIGLSTLARAEESYLRGKDEETLHHLGKVEAEFPRGSREWLRIQDIRAQVEQRMQKKK